MNIAILSKQKDDGNPNSYCPTNYSKKNEFSQLSPRKIGDKEIRKKLKFREESGLVLSHI